MARSSGGFPGPPWSITGLPLSSCPPTPADTKIPTRRQPFLPWPPTSKWPVPALPLLSSPGHPVSFTPVPNTGNHPSYLHRCKCGVRPWSHLPLWRGTQCQDSSEWAPRKHWWKARGSWLTGPTPLAFFGIHCCSPGQLPSPALPHPHPSESPISTSYKFCHLHGRGGPRLPPPAQPLPFPPGFFSASLLSGLPPAPFCWLLHRTAQ